jgi:hypothetical protein
VDNPVKAAPAFTVEWTDATDEYDAEYDAEYDITRWNAFVPALRPGTLDATVVHQLVVTVDPDGVGVDPSIVWVVYLQDAQIMPGGEETERCEHGDAATLEDAQAAAEAALAAWPYAGTPGAPRDR